MASCWKLPSEYTKSCKQFTFHGSRVYGEASNTNDSPRGSRRNKISNPLQTEKHGMAKVGRMGYRLEMRHLECVRGTGPFPIATCILWRRSVNTASAIPEMTSSALLTLSTLLACRVSLPVPNSACHLQLLLPGYLHEFIFRPSAVRQQNFLCPLSLSPPWFSL